MNKLYDILVLIGRFQGPHKAHFELLERAGKQANKVIVIIGSAYAPRSPKNPWTADERASMLSSELDRLANFTGASYYIEYNVDTMYDDDGWVARVQSIVNKHSDTNSRIGLIGHDKDMDTKRYLDMFPQWESVKQELIEVLDATQIREIYFSDKFNQNFLVGVMPQSVISFLMKFRETEDFHNIMEEKVIIASRRKEYDSLPYPHIAVTVDAVVTQGGHVLLIKRRSHPGKGLWALPGGYFDAEKDNEPVDGILRELEEETKIDVPKKVLRGSIKEIKTFSAKNRSQLGRSITFAAHIPLSGGEWKLPRVKGSDDAEKAKWIPFVDIRREMLFDDHFDIITNFISIAK